MKRITEKVEKAIAENLGNAKRINGIRYLETENLIDESEQLMRETEIKAESVVLTAQGQAKKTMKKVL